MQMTSKSMFDCSVDADCLVINLHPLLVVCSPDFVFAAEVALSPNPHFHREPILLDNADARTILLYMMPQ